MDCSHFLRELEEPRLSADDRPSTYVVLFAFRHLVRESITANPIGRPRVYDLLLDILYFLRQGTGFVRSHYKTADVVGIAGGHAIDVPQPNEIADLIAESCNGVTCDS